MTTKINIDKAALLRASNHGLNFYSFVMPQLKMLKEGEVCENTYNPFYPDKNPSFSIYFSPKMGRWMFKDYGGAPDGREYSGDVFDFAGLYYEMAGLKLTFGQRLFKIAEDLGIDPQTVKSKARSYAGNIAVGFRKLNAKDHAREVGFNLLSDEYSGCIADAHSYFSHYGISEDVLLRYNVKAVKRYLYIDKDGVLQSRNCSDALVIAYEDVYGAKIYQPSPKKFWYIGKKSPDYIFGFNQLLARNRRSGYDQQETLIITGGEKDVLTLTSLGFDAVCFNSETAGIPKLATDVLFHWYKRIIVMYDNDPTGLASTIKVVKRLKADFNVAGFKWGSNLKEAGGKDVSDYIRLKLDIDLLREQIACCEGEGDTEDQPTLIDGSEVPDMKVPAEAYTPHIPEEVYRDLPEFFKRLCDQFPDRTDKDILLLSALAVVSSFFPRVYGEHARDKVGSNIYLFVSGPSAAGKGVMAWSRRLGNKIQAYLAQKFITEMANYEAELAAYRSDGNPDTPKPLKPQQQTMFIPANCSVSKIIQFLGANQNFGVIMETEADTLAAAFKNDWGNFSDVLRKAFHHETVSLARKTNDEFIEIERPHLSVVLSGTFNQVGNLLDSVENGLFSRFLFYEFRSSQQWKNMYIQQDGSSELADLFDEAGSQILNWWERYYDGEDCIVRLQQQQIDRLNQYFAQKLEYFISEHGDPIGANIKRAALSCYRITIILTVVRHVVSGQQLPEALSVEDADFNSALGIVDTLNYHLQKTYSRLENSSKSSKLKAQPRALYDALPEEFSRQEYNGIAEKLKIKYKTAERYLEVLFREKLLERYEQGEYRKL